MLLSSEITLGLSAILSVIFSVHSVLFWVSFLAFSPQGTCSRFVDWRSVRIANSFARHQLRFFRPPHFLGFSSFSIGKARFYISDTRPGFRFIFVQVVAANARDPTRSLISSASSNPSPSFQRRSSRGEEMSI